MQQTGGLLTDLFYGSVDAHRKADHLKHKVAGQWRDISSDEFRRAVEEASLGLRELGIGQGDRVALLSENRPEWAFADLATLSAAAVVVPIYATLTAAQALYILNDSEAKVCFVSTAAQLQKVQEIRAQAPCLRHVIRFEPGAGADVISLDDLRARGRGPLAADPQAVRRRAAEARPDDLATLVYTSGTTGEPKGVMLTHHNIVSNVEASKKIFMEFGPNDVALSFLPLSHIFERMAGYYMMLASGSTIAYAESVEQVPANMAEVRPTVMCSVPRLYEKMYARINEKVASDPPARQKVFRWAIGVGREVFRAQMEKRSPGPLIKLQSALANKLVFSKVKDRVGGRLRVFVSGGAPLAREIGEFFGAAGLTILEGYGLTETSPVITCNRPDDFRPGTVGKPIPGVEVKIADDGEILTRGPHVMKGYYKKPQDTAEVIDAEGWLHTGDVGAFDRDGFLVITDRKKDIIVTSGGKNIAPQPIENLLKTNAYIGEIVMIGNKRHFPAALVIPKFENLEKWAKERGLAFSTREELVARPEVVELYDRTVRDLTAHLASFEKIKKLALLPREFSLETGELTPKLSVKRRVVEQKYKDVIDRLYEGGAAA
ncbi:MAG TPA: long-chain fatty acid--CoA ligase [Vicinamibacteria bacterium]